MRRERLFHLSQVCRSSMKMKATFKATRGALLVLTSLALIFVVSQVSTLETTNGHKFRAALSTHKDFRRHSKRHSETLEDSLSPHYEPFMLGDSDGSSSHASDSLEPEAGQMLTSRQQQARGKRTLYACEEKQLQIECQLGESIQLIRANYGRFSIQICNEHGQLDWKVNCMSPASFQIISNSCQAKQSCQLLASNTIFGDSCPGTQKYLEVHYQCVASAGTNRTTLGEQAQTLTSVRHPSVGGQQQQRPASNKQNVIQQQQAQQDTSTITSEMASRPPIGISGASNSLVPPSYAPTMQFGWPLAASSSQAASFGARQQQQQPTATSQLALPPWMREVPLATATGGPFMDISFGATSSSAISSATNRDSNASASSAPTATTTANSDQQQQAPERPLAAHCPETVWRQIRWPASEAGQVVQMPCPAHAHSGNPADSYPASFVCLPNANWAPRVQAARCQSIWLRNLTQRLEAGDSPLSIVNELALRTRLPATPLMALAAAGSWSASGVAQNHYALSVGQPGLFGDDIVQIGRIVRRLVDELDDLLNRISDDKQRLAFAREIVQSLVELVNNLAHEQQLDAWLDLAQNQGERQRIAGQLVQSLEGATVLLASSAQGGHSSSAGAAGSSSSSSSSSSQQQLLMGTEEPAAFVKVTENAYVAIRAFQVPSGAGNSAARQASSLEVSFPSETSTLGTKWQAAEQRFTLHLQTSNEPAAATTSTAQADILKYPPTTTQDEQLASNSVPATGASQTLKIAFVMIRGLGSQMEPKTLNSGDGIQSQERLVVNSDLVSLLIVADSRYKYTPVKVDFSAPIELVFRHLDSVSSSSSSTRSSVGAEWPPATAATNKKAPRCAYWDTNISDWLSKGCKLIGTNRTHSTCACDHLASFTLLSEWDEQQQQFGLTSGGQSVAFDGAGQNQHRQEQQQPKVQLDSVENELILPTKLLYLAKMLDGRLFDADQQQQPPATMAPVTTGAATSTNLRLLIYVSCLASAALLALYLASAAYNQAHERRLLGAIPAQPPPPLLVSNSLMSAASMRNSIPSSLHHNHHHLQQRQQQLVGGSSSIPVHVPSYGSDYSAALNANKIKLQTEGFDSPTMAQAIFLSSCNTTAKGAPSTGTITATGRLDVPIHLIVQLFALQLLIVLLVACQNYLQRSAAASRHAYLGSSQYQYPQLVPISSMLEPIGTITWILVLGLYYLIASITCWLLGQLIKLNYNLLLGCPRRSKSSGASFDGSCGKQLIGGQLGSSASTSSSSSSDKSVQYGVTNSTALSSLAAVNSAIYGRNQPLAVGSANLYGAPGGTNNNGACAYGAGQQQAVYGNHHQQQQPTSGGLLQSSTSPTSSFSSTGGQSSTIMAADQHAALSRLEVDSAHLYASAKHHNVAKTTKRQSRACQSLLAKLLDPSTGKPLNLLVVHTLPLAWVALIACLSSSQSQTLNSFAFTTSLSSQLASWPLLVDASLGLPLATLLYYGPAVCLILLGLAVFALRRSQPRAMGSRNVATIINGPSSNATGATRNSGNPASSVVNPYGSSSLVNPSLGLGSSHHLMANNFLVSTSSALGSHGSEQRELREREMEQQQQQQMALNKQSMCQRENQPAAYYWQTDDSKRAKFACAMLLVLLALHSICWISFFAHLQRALNWAHPSHCRYLIYAFTLANLLLVLVIIWSQRRALRRAAQLAGLTRLLGCLCACLVSAARSGSPAIGGSVATNSAAYQRGRFYRAAQQQQDSMKSAGGVKVSPSSQSLFLVSQAAQQQQAAESQQQYQLSGNSTSYHYGPSYSSGSSQALQAQQHLYQQLANQQHLYDSTTAINEQQQQQQQQQLSVMQLMQQQRHLHQMHQLDHQQQQHHSFTLNRSVQHHQMQQHQQQQLQKQPMTLKPMVGANSTVQQFGGQRQSSPGELMVSQQADANGQLLVLSANGIGGLKQQQQPFVCRSIEQQHGQGKSTRQQQQSGEADGPLVAFNSGQPAATFGPNNNNNSTAATAIATPVASHRHLHSKQHQLFSQQQQEQSQPSSPVNCNSAATTTSGNSGCTSDANQHQYYSITNTNTNNAGNNNNNDVSGSRHQAQQQQPANYTDALKAMIQQQQNESPQHFRRSNSRQQQRHQPAMMDRQQQQQHNQMGVVYCVGGNIYDVANYALGQ